MTTQTTTEKASIFASIANYVQATDEYMARREAERKEANKRIETYYSGTLDAYCTVPDEYDENGNLI